MSSKDYKRKKVNKEEARKLVIKAAVAGRVVFSAHALQRMTERDIITNDILNVLLSTSMRISEGEAESGTYRYQCQTNRFVVVIGFTVQGDGLVVVTVWKSERKAK